MTTAPPMPDQAHTLAAKQRADWLTHRAPRRNARRRAHICRRNQRRAPLITTDN